MPHPTDEDAEDPMLEELINEGNNVTAMELPEGGIPALPPLPQPDQDQDEDQDEDQDQQANSNSHSQEPESESAALAMRVSEVSKSFKTTLHFKTDLPKSARDAHPCGILHFVRTSGPLGTEEHAFAWIEHHEIGEHVGTALGHMEKFGFDPSNATFVPYSSRRAWVEKYPFAFPHVHCGSNGHVTGFPFYSGGVGGGGGGGGGGNIAIERMMMASGATATADAVAAAAISSTAAASEARPPARGRKKKKIFPAAHLPNDERDELHIEMYKYLRWLHRSLAMDTPPVPPAGGDETAPRPATSGINVAALQSLMEGMEATFRVVRNAQPSIVADEGAAVAGDTDTPASALPFLEEVLEEPLGKLVDAVKRDPKQRTQRKKRTQGQDFDDMFERLVKFHQEHGHVNVPQKYSQDGQLGSWVANMRSKRKAMAKRGEEFELEARPEDEEDDGEDDNNNDEEGGDDGEGVDGEDGEGGAVEGVKKRRKHKGGRQRLTRERIHRMDTVGFQWVVANPNTKSWVERFEDLKEYQHLHGTTRVPRSSGTLGEWVHMQRRLYNKKDNNFLTKKAPLLDDIGFEWHPRKHALVSWEDNFNRLVEFGRLNRHYNVHSPFPEGYVGDYEGEDGELVEAHRFHKWVKRIHAEYRSYASGKGSRMLNDNRVMQLREVGFHFI